MSVLFPERSTALPVAVSCGARWAGNPSTQGSLPSAASDLARQGIHMCDSRTESCRPAGAVKYFPPCWACAGPRSARRS